MHELSSFLTHIPTYFQHKYDVISMLYIDFWGFTKDPIYLGYNSAGQENHVLCIFLLSGTLMKSK
jgi:hypothetical protein